jgi:hydrogenase nickel incorporation protein HypA/HybF
MHEMSIANNLMEIIEKALQGHSVHKVLSFKLKIGELRAVEPEALRFCFGVLSKGTPLENTKMIIEDVPAGARCNKCKKEFLIKDLTFFCPHCGSAEIEPLSGNELDLVSIEVEEDERD